MFTFSSLVALLALLTSILWKISSLSRFHNTPFCKFDFFPCNFSKIHFALKEIHTHGNISILASKDNILESGLNSGMQGTTVHWNKQLFFLFHKKIYEKTNHVFQMYIDNVSFILQDFFAKNVQIFQFPTREPPPSLLMRWNTTKLSLIEHRFNTGFASYLPWLLGRRFSSRDLNWSTGVGQG